MTFEEAFQDALGPIESLSHEVLPGMKTTVTRSPHSDSIEIGSSLLLHVQNSVSMRNFEMRKTSEARGMIGNIIEMNGQQMVDYLQSNLMAQRQAKQQSLAQIQALGQANHSADALSYALAQQKQMLQNNTEIKPKKEQPMFKGITQDIRSFISENKQVIYWIALIMIVDHYFFENAFREKLKKCVHGLIGKVENQIGHTTDEKVA